MRPGADAGQGRVRRRGLADPGRRDRSAGLKRSLVFAGATGLEATVELARAAEAAGLHRVWTTETPSRDAVLRAARIALATRTIGVGTGIAYAFTRAPLATAALAAEVQVLSGGRFLLGLGSMTRGMRRHWYGLELDHPASRLAEYVRLVKAALAADGALSFAGRWYQADVPEFALLGDPALIRALPIYGSGVNAAMLRSCAAACDGIALHPLAGSLPYLDRVVAPIARGVPLAAWRITSLHENGERARDAARRNVAFYLSTPSYRTTGEGRPWEARVGEIQRAFREALPPVDWGALAAMVGDDMLDELTLAGTPDEVRDRLPALEAELARRGVDELVFQPAGIGLGEAEMLAGCRLIIGALA